MKAIDQAVDEARAEVDRLFEEARIDIDRAIDAAKRRAFRETMWAFWGAVLVAFLSGVVMGWTLQTLRLK